jgi:dTDP-4-dehydrorhamnose reductase
MWLVVGGDSEIGAALYRRLVETGRPAMATTRRRGLVGPRRPFLDLAAPLGEWEPPEGTTAACIAAGVARLAACAADPDGSAAVNVTGTLALVERLLARDVHVVFLSSDKVFDGTVPHVPAAAPACPTSEYGRQKARTEHVLKTHLERGAAVAILRLAKVLPAGAPLFTGWAQALSAGRRVRAFDDMTLAPVPVRIVVEAIAALMRDRRRGIFQLSGPADATYAEAARHLAVRLGADPRLVDGISAAGEMPAGAASQHTTLDSAALREAYGLAVPGVWETVEAAAGIDRAPAGACGESGSTMRGGAPSRDDVR